MTPSRADKVLSNYHLNPRLGIVVHSHLRWDFVWQRPQQIFSRVAKQNRVLFVEEPSFVDDRSQPTLSITLTGGVLRAVPLIPRDLAADYDTMVGVIRNLLVRALRQAPLARQFQDVIQWFYTPMPAEQMIDAFGERAVVYDCMDELSQFRFAPPDIGRRERVLLSRADIVFTGGHRLYQLKSHYHSNVHFLGCGVDAEHFGQARRDDTVIPGDVADLPSPILGYFGVIDERLDYELLRTLAATFSHGTLLMIGPTAKVDPASLPHAPNVRWLGQRAYADLPAYLKAFDVCLMPFALNEATEYINPTKTLEYMAAGKPIVSTAVADVMHHFSSVVAVAKSSIEFISAVAESVGRQCTERVREGVQVAAAQSWESVVQRMTALTGKVVEQRRQRLVAHSPVLAPSGETGGRGRAATPSYADPIAEAS